MFAPGPAGTVLAEQEGRAPLRVVRPFPLGGGEALLQIVHIGPGLLAGDRLELELTVRAGAAAVVVAQSASKIHRMEPPGEARQRVRLRVEAGGRLEVLGGLVIPFPGSAFAQAVEVDLGSGASFAWLERWALGRAERGEVGRFRRLGSRFALRLDGVLRYADALELEGPGALRIGLAEGRRYLAAGVFVGGPPPVVPADPDGNVELGVGDFGAGHYLRALADDGLALRRALERVANDRRTAASRPAIAFDRYGS